MPPRRWQETKMFGLGGFRGPGRVWVPGLGEAVIDVPVTVSAMNIARQVGGPMGGGGGKPLQKVDYELNGKLHGSTFSSVRFKSAGTLDLPRPGATGTAETQSQ